MSRYIKNKYRVIRSEFRRDLYSAIKKNPAIGMLAIETYIASQHRTHIMQIWELLGFDHRAAYKDYCDKLCSKHLTGRSEIMRSLHFAAPDLYEKYFCRIPERMAMGDALAVAYKAMR